MILNQRGSRISILSWLIYGAVCVLLGMVLSSYANTYSIPDYSDWEAGTYSNTDNSSGINIAANMLHVVPQSITITNPDAETADTTGWSCQDSNGGACGLFSATTGDGPPYAGSYHFKIWDATYSSIMQQSVTVTSGTGYKLQAYVKWGNATIRVRTGSYTAGVNRCESSAATGPYTLLTCDFVAQETNLYIQLVTSGANEASLMDNVSIVTILGTWESTDVDLGYSTSVSAVKWYGDETATAYWDTNTSGAKQIEIKCATTQGGLTSASYSAVSYNADPGCDTIQWVKVKVTGQLTATQDTLKRPHLWGIDVIYNDPPDWTGRACSSKKQLQVDNNGDATITSGETIDLLPGVFDISIASPDTISIVRYTGSWTELARRIRGKTIHFKAQADIGSFKTDTSYWVYYGCTTGTPTTTGSGVYSLFDDFDDNSFNGSNWTRRSMAFQYGDEFDSGTLDSNISTYTTGAGSITEVTGETEAFTSSIPSTFTSLVAGDQTATSTGGVARLTIPASSESTDDAGIIYRNEQSYRRFFSEPATVSIRSYVDSMVDNSSVYMLGMWEGTPAITTSATFLTKRMLSVEVVRSGASYSWRVVYRAKIGEQVYWDGDRWIPTVASSFGTVSLATWYKVKLIFSEYTVKVRIETDGGTLIEETEPIGIFWLGMSNLDNQLYWFWGEPLNNAGWAKLDSDDFDINWGQMKIYQAAETDVATATMKVSDGSGKWNDLISDARVNVESIYDTPTIGGFLRVLGLYESADTTIAVGCASGGEERMIITIRRVGSNYYNRIIYYNASCVAYFWDGSSWTTTTSDVSGVTLNRHFGYRIECTNADGCRARVIDDTGVGITETTYVPWATMQNDAGIADANNWRVGIGDNHATYFYGTMYVDHWRVYKPGTAGVVEQNQRIELTATGKYDYSWVQKVSGSTSIRRLYTKITTGSASGQRIRIGFAFDAQHVSQSLRWMAWTELVTGSSDVIMARRLYSALIYTHNGIADMTEALATSTSYEVEMWQKNATVYLKIYKASDGSLVYSQAFANGDYDYTGLNSLTMYPTIMVWNDNNVSSSVFYIDDYGDSAQSLPALSVNPFTRANKVGNRHQIDDAGRVWYARDTRLFYSSDSMMEDEHLVLDFGDSGGFNNQNHIHWIWISKDYGSGQYLFVGTREDNKFYISINCNLDPLSDLCDTTAEWTAIDATTTMGSITGCSMRPLDVQGGTYAEVLLAACYGYPSDTKEHIIRSTNWRNNATPTWSHSLLSNVATVMHTHQVEEHKNTNVLYTSSHIPRSYKSTDGGQNWTTILDKLFLFRGSSIPTSTAMIVIADSEQWNIIFTTISGSGTEEKDNLTIRYGAICYLCNIDLPKYTNTWDGNNGKVYALGMIWPGNTGSSDSIAGVVYSDNNGLSWERIYDTCKGYDATFGIKHTKGWVSYSKVSLYEVFYESGIHNILDAATQWRYGTKKSNFTVKTGRSTPIKGLYEQMQHFNDSWYGGY